MTRELQHVDGVEHRFVNAGGLRTHVAEAGDPEAPPLLMLHGWPQHWWMWRRHIGPLSETHRVIAPDLRGLGWTAAPPGGYDPEVFARDIVALLDALEIESVDFMGHDWGGWTGFMLGLHHPERLRRLLALGIVHPFAGVTPRAALGFWRFWYQWVLGTPGIGPFALRSAVKRNNPMLRYLGARDDVWDDEALEAYAGQFREPERVTASVLLYRHASLRLQLRIREYRRMHMDHPVLLVFPAEDAVQKDIRLEGAERNAPNMQIEVVPDAGHFIVDEQPELVLDRARGFFAFQPRSSSPAKATTSST